MAEERYKVLIVDDEFHARKLLTDYVSELSFLELVGTSSNVFGAMNILQKEKVDILFLDIQMPQITGMDFARSLKNPPAIIFTTAYSEYAVESYELDVIDYLLKTISFPRFLQAVNKFVERRNSNTVTEKIIYNEPTTTDNILIKSGAKIYKIDLFDILYLEAMGEYVAVYTTKQKITTLSSLKSLEDRLPQNIFVRVHKSYIISVKRIDFIEKEHIYIAGKTIHIGRVYKEKIMELFDRGSV